MMVTEKIKITGGIAPGQVLQRNKMNTAAADIRGECCSSGKVRLAVVNDNKQEIIGEQIIDTAANGLFHGDINGLPVGGPYRIEITIGTDSVIIPEIFVGDVWVLAGQSNMQGIGDMKFAAEPDPLVRAFYLNRRWGLAKDPLHLLMESPDRAHVPRPVPPVAIENARKNATRGAGLGVEFGKTMVRKSGGVPQGLICTAHGGTSMDNWKPAPEDINGDTFYGSMLKSIRSTGQKISGVAWYQGESDTGPDAAPLYTGKMHDFVAAVRRDSGLTGLPFFIAQLARNFPGGKINVEEDEAGWRMVRAAQLQLRDEIDNLEVVPTLDLPLEDRIHLDSTALKKLGRRFARVAANVVYNNDEDQPPIVFRSARRAVDRPEYLTDVYAIDVEFDNISGNLQADGKPQGFSLVDVNGKSYPLIYRTRLFGKTVRLETALTTYSPDLKLAYGWNMSTLCNISDERDMAIPALGPVEVVNTVAMSDFVLKWEVGELIEHNDEFDEMKCPVYDGKADIQEFSGSCVLLPNDSAGKNAVSIFQTKIKIPEPLRLDFRFAYDAPVKVWIDRREFFADLSGSVPMGVDKQVLKWTPGAGDCEITIALKITPENPATGFRLRFSRTLLPESEFPGNTCLMPKVIL